jgi:hypothetical protein
MSIDRARIEDLQSVVRDWCSEHVGADDLAELEQVAQELSRAVGAAVMEEGLSQLGGKSSYQGSSQPCQCGRKARFVNYRKRDVGTLFGPVAVERAYYHCRQCGSGQVPWDLAQELSNLLWSPTVKLMVVQAAGRMPYGEAVEMLERMTGLRIEESCAERIVAEVGVRLRAAEAEAMSQCDRGQIAPLTAEPPGRLYASMDGTSAHIDGAWHEVKTGVIYSAQAGADGIDECADRCYVAAQEPAEAFGERLYVSAAQAGVGLAAEVVVIGDGAEWIWNLAAHHYPGATQIVDYWHACEHIYDLARALYGEGSAKGRRWARGHCERLKAGGPTSLLRALRRMKPADPEQAEAVRRELGYFTNNQKRMQYAQFRARGLMIGSGPVEAACKVVVGARLKQSGMRWSSPGADHILAVRTRLLNRHYNTLQQAARAA